MKTFLSNLHNLYIGLHLQTKLMISHLVLIIVPTIVIVSFIYGQLYSIIVSETIRQEQNFSEQSFQSFYSDVEKLEQVSASVAGSSYVQNLFSCKDKDSRSTLLNSEQTLNFNLFRNSLIDHQMITDMKLFLDLGVSDPNTTSSFFQPIKTISGSYWHGILSSKDSNLLYCPQFYLSPDEINGSGSISIVKRINYVFQNKYQSAYLVVYASRDYFDRMLAKGISENNPVSYIINDRDAVVTASDYSLTSLFLLKYEDIQEFFMTSDRYVPMTVFDTDVYACIYRLEKPDWYMVSILPTNRFSKTGELLIVQFIAVYLLFLIISFLLVSLLSRSLTKRLNAVIEQMKSVRIGPPRPMDAPVIHDEIGTLIDTYNYMSDEMNLLLEKEKQTAQSLRLSELKALQSQINPHFLYNTLDMINWLIHNGQNEKASEAVKAMSRFYKLTLNKGNLISSIKEELTQVTLYVALQNMRFEDNIQFIVDVPEEFMDFEIPKLVLQPLVENSILHGIFEKESKEGTIVITGWQEDSNLTLIISDDGIGMSPEQLESVKNGKGENPRGSNIGIFNTNSRLKLFYSDPFGLSYRSTKGAGTEVTIRIPARKYNNEIR